MRDKIARRNVAPMETKLSFVVAAFNAGDFCKALTLAAKFPKLGDQRSAILDGHAAYASPGFMQQLGKDPEALKIAGIAALRSRYSL